MRAFITRQLISNSFRKECKTVYNNFNSVDIIKRFNDQFTSTIYQQFVDDLYYCIWHLENYYFDKIWAFRFQNSPKYNQMASLSFLKNVYRGSCSFLIPHGNLSSFIQSSIFQPFRLILKNENKVISFNLSFWYKNIYSCSFYRWNCCFFTVPEGNPNLHFFQITIEGLFSFRVIIFITV